MKVKDHKDGKMIILSTAFDTRPKILNLIYFINFFAGGTIILRLFLTDVDKIAVIILGCIITAGIYLIAYRFVNKAVAAEKIFINAAHLELIRQGLFRSRRQRLI